MKVGKEEIMGMLAAVEMWVKRDHKAEWALWERWLDTIAASVRKVDGVTARVLQPGEGLSNRTPRLMIEWDGAKLGITGQEVAKLLLDSEPRIVLASGSGNRPGAMLSSVSVVPYMMMPGEEKIVADRLHSALSKPPKFSDPAPDPQGRPAAVGGQWAIRLEFGRGSATHKIVLEQDGGKLAGSHQAEFYAGNLSGAVAANTVRFRSSFRAEGQGLSFSFTGTVDGERMSGVVNLGEYGETKWTAEKLRA
jgi:L-seryl-tRNA(Ser) seleniumtransferase